jgi:hypothetical protein
MAKKTTPAYTPNEIREMMLRYFYNRNANATSIMGKKGSAVKISDVKKELKAEHSLEASQVISNLNYLMSQGWVQEKVVEKSFTTKTGTVIPSTTEFYTITAQGIDKIEGPSPFTPDRFAGIKIEATGQNIITLGDGNQIQVKYETVGKALSALREAVTRSTELSEEAKFEVVNDIDTISTQLAKPTPNGTVIRSVWENINRAASVGSLVDLAVKVGTLILSNFPQ